MQKSSALQRSSMVTGPLCVAIVTATGPLPRSMCAGQLLESSSYFIRRSRQSAARQFTGDRPSVSTATPDR